MLRPNLSSSRMLFPGAFYLDHWKQEAGDVSVVNVLL